MKGLRTSSPPLAMLENVPWLQEKVKGVNHHERHSPAHARGRGLKPRQAGFKACSLLFSIFS